MNLEDRLKQHFDDEAEHLYAPAGSVDAAKRRGSRRRATRFVAGTTLAFAIVGGTGVAITVANSGGDGDGNDVVAAVESADDLTDDSAATRPAPITSEQIGDVLPTVAYDWESVELPFGSSPAYGGTAAISYAGGTFVAIHQEFDEATGPISRTFTSTDGRNWTEGDRLELSWTDSILATGSGFVAFGQQVDGGFAIASSPDGQTWMVDAVESEGDGHLASVHAASGNGITVLAGSVWYEPPIPPIELPEAGIVVVEEDGRLLVNSLETGEFLFESSYEVLYGGNEGLTVWDEETSEVIAVFSYEALDLAYADMGESGTITLSQDGFTLEINEEDFTYELRDADGNLIQGGSQENLYRRPRFVLTHPDTGEIVVDIPIEDFEEAQEAAYRDQPSEEDGSETVVYYSAGGTDWSAITVDLAGASTEREVLGLAYLDGEFVLLTSYWDGANGGVRVYRSADGIEWTEAGLSDVGELSTVSQAGESLVAISYARGSSIVTSADGITWDEGPAFGSGVSVYQISDGVLPVAFGTTSPDYTEPIITTVIDGKQLTLDGSGGYLSVTDVASDQVLTEIYFDPEIEEPPAGIELSFDGFDIYDGEGNLVLEVDNADMEAAYAEIAPQFEEFTSSPVLFTLADGDWARVTTEGLDVDWVRSVAAADDGTIVVSGEGVFEGASSGTLHSIGSTTEATLIAPAIERVPTTSLIWVGTKR